MNTADLAALIQPLPVPTGQRSFGEDKVRIDAQDKGDHLALTLTFPYPVCHITEAVSAAVRTALAPVLAGRQLQLTVNSDISARQVQPGVKTIAGVKNIIAVASGKGGVGKSTTSANLALALSRMGARVGVLDADIYGPSQPAMFGVADAAPAQQDGALIPVRDANGIQIMSIGFLVDANQAVVWRGPMVSQALQQMLFQSRWDHVDYLIVDLPPGTGDVQLTLSQKIPVTGAVVVTTPQDIALLDARKAVDMFGKVQIPIFGVLENMSVHVCSQCGHAEPIFGCDGGKRLAETLGLPLLGQLPLSLPVRLAMDAGRPGELFDQQPAVAAAYQQAAWSLVQAVAAKARDFSSRFPQIVVE